MGIFKRSSVIYISNTLKGFLSKTLELSVQILPNLSQEMTCLWNHPFWFRDCEIICRRKMLKFMWQICNAIMFFKEFTPGKQRHKKKKEEKGFLVSNGCPEAFWKEVVLKNRCDRAFLLIRQTRNLWVYFRSDSKTVFSKQRFCSSS